MTDTTHSDDIRNIVHDEEVLGRLLANDGKEHGISFMKDGVEHRRIYQNGLLRADAQFKGSEKLGERRFEYDEKGSSVYEYDPQGKMASAQRYDKKGQISVLERYEDGTLIGSSTYEDGKATSMYGLDKKTGKAFLEEYLTNSRGIESIRMTQIKDGKITGRTEEKYGETREIESHRNGEEFSFEKFMSGRKLMINEENATLDQEMKNSTVEKESKTAEKEAEPERPMKEEPVKEEKPQSKEVNDVAGIEAEQEKPAKNEKKPAGKEAEPEKPAKEVNEAAGKDAKPENTEKVGKEADQEETAGKESEAEKPAKEAAEENTFGMLLPSAENQGKAESEDDLKKQMWNLTWKNKFFGFEYDDDKKGKFPFVQGKPDTIKYGSEPPSVSMELANGSKLTNTANGICLDYKGKPRPEDFMTMVRLGQEKGWKSANIDPETSPEFKKNMYIAMKTMGMEISNLKALNFSEKDLAEMDKEVEKAKEKYAPTLDKMKAMDEKFPALDAARKEAQGKKSDLEAFNDITSEDYKKLNEKIAGGQEKSKTAETNVAEPKATEPKAAEPKAAEPKAAEPKAAEPKAAEPKAAEPKAAEPKAAEPRKETLSQSMQKVVSEMAKANGVELNSKDSKETTKAAAKMSRGIKSLPPELQEKFGKVVENLVENHPDIAKQLVVDLNSNGKQGPARVVKAYSNALNRVREAEAKGQKSTTRQTEQQKQDMTNKIISGIKKNSRG